MIELEPGEQLIALSLGAGVQSSTVALMAERGEITPKPHCAIFADTGAEPEHVYFWLDWLESQLSFPIYRVSKGDGLTASILASTRPNEEGGFIGRFAGAPFYTTSANGGGMLRRQCTREFKIEPITRQIRALLGLKKGERAARGRILAEQWIGISLDEMQRMKDPREKWLVHRWPLVEKRMTRLHCLEWFRDNGYNQLPKKSACTYCPYHDNAMWRDMKANDPASWKDAVLMDEAIRTGVRGTTERLYVHSSMVPLVEVDLTDPAADQSQMSFMDECDGMCGV